MYPLEFVPVLSGRYRPLLQKVAKCKKYNKFKDFAFNTLAFQKVTNMTFKYSNFRALKSVNPKSSGGSAPWTPGRGSARGPKAGPWTPPKIGSRLRARYVRSAHMFAPPKNRNVCPQKIGPQQFKKIGSRTCLPPHNQSLPPSCPPPPPLFKSWCRHWFC